MDEVVAEIRTCRRCLLWRSAKNVVPGEGSLDPPIILIGEAPGYWEDIKGRPFIGASGKLLDKLLSSIELKRCEIYLGNIIKHRPPENRNPRLDEIKACTPFLDRQIKILKPKGIVSLGKYSTEYILSKANIEVRGINSVRGQIYRTRLLDLPVKILPTLHPAAALYNPNYKSVLKDDFQKIKTELKK